jgi:hypothetical protein
MHGGSDDGSGGGQPDQPRETTQEEDAAGEEQGPEGKAGGDREGQNRVVPRRHKSISIDMFVFIFHRGYSFLGFPWLGYELNNSKLLSRKDLGASHIWIDLSCLLVRTYEYLSTDSLLCGCGIMLRKVVIFRMEIPKGVSQVLVFKGFTHSEYMRKVCGIPNDLFRRD